MYFDPDFVNDNIENKFRSDPQSFCDSLQGKMCETAFSALANMKAKTPGGRTDTNLSLISVGLSNNIQRV